VSTVAQISCFIKLGLFGIPGTERRSLLILFDQFRLLISLQL